MVYQWENNIIWGSTPKIWGFRGSKDKREVVFKQLHGKLTSYLFSDIIYSFDYNDYNEENTVWGLIHISYIQSVLIQYFNRNWATKSQFVLAGFSKNDTKIIKIFVIGMQTVKFNFMKWNYLFCLSCQMKRVFALN